MDLFEYLRYSFELNFLKPDGKSGKDGYVFQIFPFLRLLN